MHPAWDLANYVVETVLDNNLSEEWPFIGEFKDNKMSDEEIDSMI